METTRKTTYGTINVDRKRIRPFFSMVFILGIIALLIFVMVTKIVDEHQYIALLFAPIVALGFYQMAEGIKKMTSEKPEFTLTLDKIVVHDNSKCREIFFSDLVGCQIHRSTYGSPVLVLEMKEDSEKTHCKSVIRDGKRTISLSLKYVRLHSFRLSRFIKYRIKKQAGKEI